MVEALDIHVQGIVQGVGFRPFVYRMAKKYLINGWVLNAVDGVHIHAEGESKLLDEFVMELSDNAPAAARVTEIDLKEVPLEDFGSFEIRFSDEASSHETTLVSPDLATCDDCLRELFDPDDRRFRYPFINCTNCGPRFTIIEELPYDRASTSMRDFAMCPQCEKEYGDPLDRRFHAQPDACFACGPALTWREVDAVAQVLAATGDGPCASEAAPLFERPMSAFARVAHGREESDAMLARAVDLLCAGGIVAVKGLGGFHLVCDARNEDAVAKLRARKRREGKAFAVMMENAEAAGGTCLVNNAERALLESPQRPIVLLRKRAGAALAAGVADGLAELGVMLPYTPVQHLLMHDFAERWQGVEAPMLIMTSGNIHDEPIVVSDEEAYEKLSGIADGFLGNNRAILTRFDDSVVRVIEAGSAGHAIQFVRRARGWAPLPLSIEKLASARAEAADAAAADSPVEEPVAAGGAPCAAADRAVFAAGPEQKSTFALLRGTEAFVSQHIGDMENAETYSAWLAAKSRYEKLFNAAPGVIACDMHPEYLASKWAHEQDLPVVEVQHHHAHIAAAMAENDLADAVCGIAFDGTGYGVDGAIWGGEALIANLQAFERFANFAYVPMPGGAAAVKNPLRMAYGVLWECDLLEHPAAAGLLERLGEQADVCETMIERGLNTPMTSSAGRLFDAASALLGVCETPAYEGEGAIMLEAAVWAGLGDGPAVAAPDEADREAEQRYAVAVVKNTATETSTARDTSVLLLDPEPTFRAVLDDMQAGVATPVIARRFHNAIVGVVCMVAELSRALYGIDTVVLAGGVFMNRYLVERSLALLEQAGMRAAVNRDLPPNDGSVSFGQAVVAWASERAK